MWLVLILKIPVVGLFGIIWWAIKDAPDPDVSTEEDDGPRHPRRPHPVTPLYPRRGPHGNSGADRIPPPPRTRGATARARVEQD